MGLVINVTREEFMRLYRNATGNVYQPQIFYNNDESELRKGNSCQICTNKNMTD